MHKNFLEYTIVTLLFMIVGALSYIIFFDQDALIDDSPELAEGEMEIVAFDSSLVCSTQILSANLIAQYNAFIEAQDAARQARARQEEEEAARLQAEADAERAKLEAQLQEELASKEQIPEEEPEPTPEPDPEPEPDPAPEPTPEPEETVLGETYILTIPSVGIETPIYWDVDGTNPDNYFPVLEKGVAHYAGTPRPGQGGSSLIFGHSSFFKDLPNNFDEIFLELHDVQIGDKIYVENKDNRYVYEIYGTKIIEPTDPEFLSQEGPDRITLLTCTPPGSIAKRLLVYAEQIEP